MPVADASGAPLAGEAPANTADISNIETGLANLLSSARSALNLDSADIKFAYDVTASLNASVTGSVTLVPGGLLVLRKVQLGLAVSKASDYPGMPFSESDVILAKECP